MMRKSRALLVALPVMVAGTAFAAGPVAPGDVTITDGTVAESLTGAPGDAANGRAVFANRSLGNCLACHAVDDQSAELFHGDVGPELNGVGDRYSAEELRAIVVNSKEALSPETIMPGFYSLNVGVNVAEEFVGKTILSAQEVEDVVAYLTTLKE